MRSSADLLALFAAGAIPVLAYVSIGLWVLRALRSDASGIERAALAYVFGTGVASLAILALRTADVPITLAPLGLIAASGWWAWRPSAFERLDRPPWSRGVDFATGCVATGMVLAALAPETTWDGFEYHLPMIRAWVDGPMRALPAMLDSEFRAGIDLLYVPAVSVDQPDAAAAVSAAFAIALAVLLRAEATRRASPGAGAWTGFFALIVPLTVEAAASTYVDLGVGAYGFLALLFADRWNRHGDARNLLAAALTLAFAANAKLHAAALAPAIVLLLAFGGRRPPLREWLRCGAITAVWVAPWFVKSSLTTGNPLFPMLCSWFGYGPTTAELLLSKTMEVRHYVRVDPGLGGFAWYLASITFGRAYHIGGVVGPLLLALAPLAFRRPSRPTLVLIVVIAAFVPLQFSFMPALRFATPLLPFYALAAAVGGHRLAQSGVAARALLTGGLLAIALLQLWWMWRIDAPRLAALRDPNGFERSVFPDQVNLRAMVAAAEPVVAIPKGAVSWMPKPVYNLHWSRNGELFFDQRTRPSDALALLSTRGVRSLVLDVRPEDRAAGRTGNPLVDAWLRQGLARLALDAEPLSAARGRVWVRVDLL